MSTNLRRIFRSGEYFRHLVRATLLLLATAVLPRPAFAADPAPAASEVRVERTKRGALVHAAGGFLRVEFVSASIARVTASRTREFPVDSTHPEHNGPYFIAAYDWTPLAVDVQRSATGWRIAPTGGNDAVEVEVDAAPFRWRVRRAGTEARDAAPLVATTGAAGGIEFCAGRAVGNFSLAENERLIGFGAHRHPLNMRGRSIVLTTSELGEEGTGGGFPVPWVMSSRGYGLFLNNVDPTTRFDLGATARDQLTIDAGDGGREGWNFDLYVVAGDSYAELLRGYLRLTGRPILAEKWFFGNIQSKCCDWLADDVIYIASRFHAMQLPLDAMILDLQWREMRPDMWEWTPSFDQSQDHSKRRNLQWAPAFGDVGKMFDVLNRQGVKVGLHENTKSTYSADADGPGPYLDQAFPDVSDARVVAKMWEMHRPLVAQGADFWWHDQGERIGKDGVNGYPLRNLNGSLWAKLVVDGMHREFGQSVPVLSRSGPAGGHRYISPWPGDVPAGIKFAPLDLDYLRNGGLAGYATIGADMGGFYRGSTPDPHNEVRRICDMLLVFPVIRTHGAYYKLPWMFSGAAQNSYARYLQLRYRLLPYFYSAAIEAHETGRPILAPLCFDYGDDEKTYARDFDFLLGRDLLVAPITEEADQREVYLPAGNWRDFWSDQLHRGGQLVTIAAPLASTRSLPMLVKEGAILPMTAAAQTIPSELFDHYTFHLYPATGGTSQRTFQDRAKAMDESHVLNATLNDAAAQTTFVVEQRSPRNTRNTRGDVGGSADSGVQFATLYFHGMAKPARVTVNGRELPEQKMGATDASWSFGKSDFPLQQETTVLKVQLAGVASDASGRFECVIAK